MNDIIVIIYMNFLSLLFRIYVKATYAGSFQHLVWDAVLATDLPFFSDRNVMS